MVQRYDKLIIIQKDNRKKYLIVLVVKGNNRAFGAVEPYNKCVYTMSFGSPPL